MAKGARTKIVNTLVTLFKQIDGTGSYLTNLYSNVEGRLRFWDEVNDFPYVCVVAGPETREYLPGNFQWAYLTINIKIYVKQDDPQSELENIINDLESVIESNNNLEYDTGFTTENILILSIQTDEGVLHPYGVGEITLQIMYDK